MRALTLILSLAASGTACKQASSELASQDGSSALIFGADGSMQLVGDPIAVVESFDASASALAPVQVGSAPAAVGEVTVRSLAYRTPDDRACSIPVIPGALVCDPPAVNDSNNPDLSTDQSTRAQAISDATSGSDRSNGPLARQAPVASDFRVVVIHHPGMHCGLHYGSPKWQKRFDVSVEAAPEALAHVDKVVYDVFSAYRGNDQGFQGSGPNFATQIGFLTPVTRWSTGPTKVHLKSGAVLDVGRGQIDWQDDDPERRAGSPCTP